MIVPDFPSTSIVDNRCISQDSIVINVDVVSPAALAALHDLECSATCSKCDQ